MRRPTGVIIAPPMPCSTRAATNEPSPVESAQAIEPAAKTTMAARNMFLAPKRSAIQPEAGINTAKRQQIGRQRELKVNGIGAEVLGDRRQRGREHRRVEVLHEESRGDDERDEIAAE